MKQAIWRSKWFVPALAIAAGFAAAGFHAGHVAYSQPSKAAASAIAAAPGSAAPGDPLAGHPAPEEGTVLAGQVLEAIEVPNYTYLRLKTGDKTEAWAAVPSAKVSVGSQVRVHNAAMMTAFSSPTLHRVFDTIYFGMLDGAGPSPGPTGHGHGEQMDATRAGYHGAQPSAASSQPITVGKVKPAGGPSGTTVSDLRAKRQEFAGKSVRVRGVVVKTVPGVLDRTFVHLRDGSGRGDGKDDDLTITMATTPETGSTVLLEGVVAADRDFGSGYRYDVILESARVVSE